VAFFLAVVGWDMGRRWVGELDPAAPAATLSLGDHYAEPIAFSFFFFFFFSFGLYRVV
jgi:hypothetical protein